MEYAKGGRVAFGDEAFRLLWAEPPWIGWIVQSSVHQVWLAINVMFVRDEMSRAGAC
jgi:hypothetical protein